MCLFEVVQIYFQIEHRLFIEIMQSFTNFYWFRWTVLQINYQLILKFADKSKKTQSIVYCYIKIQDVVLS